MALLTLLNAQLAFGHVALLDHTDFSLESSERVGLIGRNGAGKSSLLKILAKLQAADDGELHQQSGIGVTYVAQEPLLDAASDVFDAVSAGLAECKRLTDLYMEGGSAEEPLDVLQVHIEQLDAWNWQQRVEEVIDRLHLPSEALIGSLSGGLKKRVALAQALVARPDVLLLDEPTNHLDMDSIRWLEGLLKDFSGSIVLISHDRAFLDAVTTRIVELDRGVLKSYLGNYAKYVTDKEAQLAQELVINAKADKLLAQEEVWIRRGVEARRTRAQGRINRLKDLRAARAARRDAVGNVRLEVATGGASGKVVAELTDVSFAYGDKKIVQNFTSTILRGDKIGLIAPNGAGKTTLLKLILGELQPTTGKVRQGANLQVAYFDQMRDALDLEASLEDFISPGSEWVEIGNQRKHVKSYLGDFLFDPARAHSPVKSLSGGERNRLLLARLFARPANVLVLDEPTNDLDIDTLELLEEMLQTYSGTVFLVSHDRTFLDNVVTSTLVWEGDQQEGQWREFVGDVSDWVVQSERTKALKEKERAKEIAVRKPEQIKVAEVTSPEAISSKPSEPALVSKRKLSYKEQRELETLPMQIEALEAEQAQIQAALADGKLYQTDAGRAQQLLKRDAEIDEALMTALTRWEALAS